MQLEPEPIRSTDTLTAEVIVDSVPHDGQFNMAMDAALLKLGATRETVIVRIYTWSEPTVTLGYFQGTGAASESPFPAHPVVRRLSGGGAILHDQELTYSCILPSTHRLRQNPSGLYEVIHESLISLLQRCGVSCCLRSQHEDKKLAGDTPMGEHETSLTEPFLCFLRSNPNDIVHASGVKIVGSAQRRRKGVTLQHGSILLSASKMTPSLPGITQLEPDWQFTTFYHDLPRTIGESVATSLMFRTYTEEELEIAAEFAECQEKPAF